MGCLKSRPVQFFDGDGVVFTYRLEKGSLMLDKDGVASGPLNDKDIEWGQVPEAHKGALKTLLDQAAKTAGGNKAEAARISIPHDVAIKKVGGKKETARISIPHDVAAKKVRGKKEETARISIPKDVVAKEAGGKREEAARISVPHDVAVKMAGGKEEAARISIPQDVERRTVEGTTAKEWAGDCSTSIMYRRHNGKRQGHSDPDAAMFLQSVKQRVKDARLLPSPPSFKNEGFALRHQPTGMQRVDFNDDAKVKKSYYTLCEDIVKQETGAARATCFHHTLRKGARSGNAIAQCDYSVKTAFDLDALDKNFNGRMCIISVWRNINRDKDVLNKHIALCDGKTVVSPDDFVFFNDPEPGGVSERFHMDPHNHKHHRWYYFSRQSADEALMYTQFDSDPSIRCRYTFTTVVSLDNDHKDFQPEMIEVRLIAYFPQQTDTMPWAPMPTYMKVFSVADSIRNDFRYLENWDAHGKKWVKDLAAKGNLKGMIIGNLTHHQKEAKRECFKGLTDEGLKQAADKILEDDFIAEQIKLKLGVNVPGVDLSSAGKGDPRGDVIASINYRRHNGKRQSNVDKDTNTFIVGVPTIVKDARQLPTAPTVKDMGFALRHQPTGMSHEDFYDDAKVTSRYYKLCEDVIKQETGATGVRCFHHAVRGKGRKPFAGIAHNDYSVKTAFSLVSKVVPSNIDMSKFKGRICVMNVWRNINPKSDLLNHHLAMCDGSTSVGPDDYVYYDIKESGNDSETFHMSPHHAKHGSHKWYYFPQMNADEALMFMQYDSDPTSRCRYTTHSSLTVNNMFTNYPRESIEVRLVAFFEQERDTMPDMTVPPHMRVESATAQVIENFHNLQHWPDDGKNWVKGLAKQGKVADLVVGQCTHLRKQGKRGSFKDLTDAEIQEVVKNCLKDGSIAKDIKKHFGITIPSS